MRGDHPAAGAIPRHAAGLGRPQPEREHLCEKFGQHQPLNQEVARFAREGMEVSLSVAADQVGAAAATLRLRHDRVEIHVFAAERQQADDITVPLVAKGKTITGRLSAQAETTRRSGVPRRERRSSDARGVERPLIRTGISPASKA
jgi:hypothetical protein